MRLRRENDMTGEEVYFQPNQLRINMDDLVCPPLRIRGQIGSASCADSISRHPTNVQSPPAPRWAIATHRCATTRIGTFPVGVVSAELAGVGAGASIDLMGLLPLQERASHLASLHSASRCLPEPPTGTPFMQA
jgi:hypothetical protein